MKVTEYKKIYGLKYLILTSFLVLAAFGSLQIGLLDPICLLVRTFAVAISPAFDMVSGELAAELDKLSGHNWWLTQLATKPGAGDQRIFAGAYVVGIMLLGLVGMNLIIPRFFCRVLCPLGALLGVLSRFALWRIERDITKCTDCDLCLKSCEGASDPHRALRKSECFVCFSCIDDCPENAISFSLTPISVFDKVVTYAKDKSATLFGKPVLSKFWRTEVTNP